MPYGREAVADRFDALRKKVQAALAEVAQEAARAPQVVVHLQKNGDVVLTADAPGIRPADISVHIEGSQLVLSGESRSVQNPGPFSEKIPLPQGVDPHNVTSTLQDGVLTITFGHLDQTIPTTSG